MAVLNAGSDPCRVSTRYRLGAIAGVGRAGLIERRMRSPSDDDGEMERWRDGEMKRWQRTTHESPTSTSDVMRRRRKGTVFRKPNKRAPSVLSFSAQTPFRKTQLNKKRQDPCRIGIFLKLLELELLIARERRKLENELKRFSGHIQIHHLEATIRLLYHRYMSS